MKIRKRREQAVHDAGLVVEALEPRQMMAAVFGAPVQGPEFREGAGTFVLADINDDGIDDRLGVSGPVLTFEVGVAGGGFEAPRETRLPGARDLGTLTTGKFLGADGGLQIAALSIFGRPGSRPGLFTAGLMIRVFAFDVNTGKPELRARRETLLGSNVYVVTSSGIAGDILGGDADELLVNVNVRETETNGRLLVRAFGMTDEGLLAPMRTLMDRSGPVRYFSYWAKRMQIADVNNDGRLDALVRPITTWRAELGPTTTSGPASLVTRPMRLADTNEAVAGGEFHFTDFNNDGITDRVLIQSRPYIEDAAARVFTVSVDTRIELGSSAFHYLPPQLQQHGVVYTGESIWDPFAQVLYSPATVRGHSGPGVAQGVRIRAAFADIDGNGHTDILLTGTIEMRDISPDTETGWRHLSFASPLMQSHTGRFDLYSADNTVADRGDIRYVLRDLNGDGKLDLLADNVPYGWFSYPSSYGTGVRRLNVT